ncbi:MAG: kinase [Candidatus Angelobacter sp.]|nr:kinase [Candidatus Angelobacter sp.]
MKKIVIVSKPSKKELEKLLPELVEWLRQRGYEVIVDPDSCMFVPQCVSVERTEIAALKPDLVIVLGGDGTLLAAARAVAKANIPILAVNLGSLGFLTEVPVSELYATFEAVEQKRFTRDSRSLLQCCVQRGDDCIAEYLALNDMVVTKSDIARMTAVDVFVNAQFVAHYKADGVIISTPTGSTAYSLAAGGPILEPSVEAFVITPVSPHALTNRPLVVRDSAEIEVVVRNTPEEAFLTVDGQVGMPVLEGDRVVCKKSEHQVHLLRLPGRTFFDVLRTKLKWGER